MAGAALAGRFPPARIMAGGLVVAAAGCVLLSQVDRSGLVLAVVGFSTVMLGVGIQASIGTELVVSAAPEERAGSAAAVSETSAELGIALGVAVLGSLAGALYQARLSETAPAGPAGATIVETRIAAEQMSGPAAADLVRSAQDAFTAALNVVATTCGAVFLALTLLTLLQLGHVRVAASPSRAHQDTPGPAR
jgi:MFS transporter, DHA2 family, multidrug resistance protein